MAAGKLSSRQKMINMMYLVLTAILALNVSSEILQAFESLRRSLSESNSHVSTSNEVLAEAIKFTVDQEVKNGAVSKAPLKEDVIRIASETSGLIKYLNDISAELEKYADKDPKTGELKKKDEQDANYRFWLGTDDMANAGHGNGKAREMRDKLEGYIKWANTLYAKFDSSTPNRFAALTMEPTDDPSITDKESKSKSWEYHTFHMKPVIADMAMVEKYKMDIRTVETALLTLIKENINIVDIPVDTLFAMDAPVSQVVAAGMPFETKIFLTAGSKEVKPEFMGQGVSVDPGGNTATMKVFANGNVIPEGKSEGVQSYTSIIKIKLRDGTTKEYSVKNQFTVRKPEVVVTSKVVQTLYRNCANTVNVDVPALGDSYNPDFSRSTGGKVVAGANSKKEVTLVPTGQQFMLSVYSNTNGQSLKISDIKYEVINPPKPQFKLSTVKGPWDGRGDIGRKEKVTIKIAPDEEFASRLRNDAKYKCTEVKLMMKDGLNGAVTLDKKSGNIMTGISFDLGSYSQLRSSGSNVIYLEAVDTKRVNFQGNEVSAGLDIYTSTIRVTLK